MSAALRLVAQPTTGFAYVSNRDRNTWAAKATSPEQWSAWKAGQWVHLSGGAVPESEVSR